MAKIFYFNGAKSKSRKRLDGKVAVCTGADSGVGFETAINLAERGFLNSVRFNNFNLKLKLFKKLKNKGACVILTGRNVEKGQNAIRKAMEINHTFDCHFEKLDLTSFDSIRQFVRTFTQKYRCLDILINNEGNLLTTQFD